MTPVLHDGMVAMAQPTTGEDDAAALVGSFRRFGPVGVTYEVIGALDRSNVTVRVVETGETLHYAVREALSDPEA